MGAEENNRNEILSQIVADLFAKSKGGDELSSKINRLRDELKKVIEGGDTIFGKLRGLVESFREIIPEEKQRYNAALQALSTTSKLSRQEIIQAVNHQIEELKILEKVLLGTAPGWRDEHKIMEAKSRETKDEISKLRQKIEQLESEEKEILGGMGARQKEMEVVEKAVGELFANIGAEITSVKKKVEEFTAESAVSQPIPPKESVKSDIPGEKKVVIEQKGEIPEASAPQDTEFEKKCPMCGGRMNLLVQDKMWQCYSCAYEEPGTRDVQDKSEEKSKAPGLSAPQDTESQKKCPMCGGRMDFYAIEQRWQCYSCAYEESKEGEVQEKSEEKSEHADTPEPAPDSESVYDNAIPTLSSREFREPTKGSIQGSSPYNKQQATQKKTCPVCRKKMNWRQEENVWQCPFCDYESKL
jgi:ribosomal protein L37AE/L43A